MNKIFFLLFCVLAGSVVSASAVNNLPDNLFKDSVLSTDTVVIFCDQLNGTDIICLSPDTNDKKKEKLISAMLAFPFPFGFMGAHRVMLGSKPWVPVVYMATFGGCFGILPMIDFCAILLSKDITQFENNPHVFMWLK
jgi:TM2 domain-containing membrane protein YozV